jgi:hypothetical protein
MPAKRGLGTLLLVRLITAAIIETPITELMSIAPPPVDAGGGPPATHPVAPKLTSPGWTKHADG